MSEKTSLSSSIGELVKLNVRRKVSQALRAGDIEVPVMPDVAQQVLSLIDNPNVSLVQLEEMIEKDQQLAARLIRVANSAAYGSMLKVTSIKRAAAIMGLKALSELVFSAAVGARIFRAKVLADPMRRIWEHSLCAAYVARRIANMKNLNSDYAFLCGLLHDIGKPLLLNAMERIYHSKTQSLMLEDAVVDEVLREFHEEVGGLVARAWKFPDMLTNTLRHHHDYTAAIEGHMMAALTQNANIFAYDLGYGSYKEPVEVDLAEDPATKELMLSLDEILLLRVEFKEAIPSLLASFS